MKKKLNKKLLNLIALCSGLTATVTLGVGGVVYSLRQEKNGGDEPVDQNILPDSVYIIENNVLMGFTKEFLADPTAYDMCDTMKIPANVTSVNGLAFYNGSESTIPEFIQNLTFGKGSVCSLIGESAFYNSSSLTCIDFSNATNLSSIGSSAFADCSALTSVDFSNATSLSTIGDNAFSFCAQITSIDLSDCTNLFSIDAFAFSLCYSLTSVSFPSSLKTIDFGVFAQCVNLVSIDLSNCNNLSSIGQHVFENCSALTSITFPSSLKEIGSLTFTLCLQLNSITWDAWKGGTSLPESDAFASVCPDGGTVTVTNPSDDAHDSIALLEYLLNNGGLPESWRPAPELPDSVYRIENNVLMGFTSEFLANPNVYRLCDTMQIPARVTSINANAFCANYKSTIPSFIKKLTFSEGSGCSSINDSAFYNCRSLISVDLSNTTNLSLIGGYAFTSCKAMTSIKFPDSLTKFKLMLFMVVHLFLL